MSSDTVVRARIDSDTKARATEALEAMGLSVSDAIRLLLMRIADEKRLPFLVQVPSQALKVVYSLFHGKKGKQVSTTFETNTLKLSVFAAL